MTKNPISMCVNDMTVFTRVLSRQLGETSPSHLALMNMVARAAGFQNVQHMRAASAAAKRLDNQTESVVADARCVERTLHQFDNCGRLLQWPAKRSVQTLALWALWATLPANKVLDEQALNDHLAQEHLFKDPATVRRTMISCGLLSRKKDGTDYRRIEQQPPVEAKALINVLSIRRRARNENAPGRA
ncbi:DUF2087 domain-containing protein [Hoeflea prorocentri]|uniref:DUF2087 domain-containing protein n=1 Tax=Hoeflea prorocentri TaxID=1922333 RepID=A0A9X3UM45_9HYPH|nr:DUF2087 domain-containing protein [Hoeflea prorocentri]MCY6382925.1 DUF2087 domain-containing protein [Hoeflea prorocentri]MDA5400725.1 DUF2087 domain-containing protein [Hoeflea prorocentri]